MCWDIPYKINWITSMKRSIGWESIGPFLCSIQDNIGPSNWAVEICTSTPLEVSVECILRLCWLVRLAGFSKFNPFQKNIRWWNKIPKHPEISSFSGNFVSLVAFEKPPDLSFFSRLLRGVVNSHNSAAYVFLGLGRALRVSDLYGFYRYVNIWVYGGLMGLLWLKYGFKKGWFAGIILGYWWIYPLIMTNIAIEHGPVEIVDLPIKNCDFPVRYVSLPEGTKYTIVEISVYWILDDSCLFHPVTNDRDPVRLVTSQYSAVEFR